LCAGPAVDEVVAGIGIEVVFIGDEAGEGALGEHGGFLGAENLGGGIYRGHREAAGVVDIDEVEDLVIEIEDPTGLADAAGWVGAGVMEDDEGVEAAIATAEDVVEIDVEWRALAGEFLGDADFCEGPIVGGGAGDYSEDAVADVIIAAGDPVKVGGLGEDGGGVVSETGDGAVDLCDLEADDAIGEGHVVRAVCEGDGTGGEIGEGGGRPAGELGDGCVEEGEGGEEGGREEEDFHGRKGAADGTGECAGSRAWRNKRGTGERGLFGEPKIQK